MTDIGVATKNFGSSLNQKQVFAEIMVEAIEMTNLADPRITKTLPMNKLRAVLPLMGRNAVSKQLDEFEHSFVSGSAPTGFPMKLFKDRVRLAKTDEAGFESDIGDPLVAQKSQAAEDLASNLNDLIAKQIAITPKEVTGQDWTSVSPLVLIGSMVNSMRPNIPSAIVMGTEAYTQYISALGDKVYSGGTEADLKKGIALVPGYAIPIFSSLDIDNNDASGSKGINLISNKTPGIVLGTGPIKMRSWDDADDGAEYWQYDIWRTPFSNVRQDATNKNLGVIHSETTG